MRVTSAPADALREEQLCAPAGVAGAGTGRGPVQLQLEALGDLFVGYKEAPLDGRGVTVVGGRPFSKVSCAGLLGRVMA
jgi:hypothetical protein